MCCVKNVKQLEKEACCCQLCSELQPHGVLFLARLLAKTSIGWVDPFMHLLVMAGVQFRCARYERTPTTEQADHFSDVTREFVPVHGHNVLCVIKTDVLQPTKCFFFVTASVLNTLSSQR